MVQPVYALALAYVPVGRRLVFRVTPKGVGGERLTPLAVFRQHLVLAVLMATAIVCGIILGHMGWPMMAWGTAIVVALAAVPFAELPSRVAVAMAGRRSALGTAGRRRVRFQGNRVVLAGGPDAAAGQVPLNHVAVPVPQGPERGVAAPSAVGERAQSGA
ncbi:hypothetical protein [Blastococcus sp. SYSU DS0973]